MGAFNLQGRLETLERNGSVSDFNQLFTEEALCDSSEGMRSVRLGSSGSHEHHRYQGTRVRIQSDYLRHRYAPLREKSSLRVLSDRFEVGNTWVVAVVFYRSSDGKGQGVKN